MSLVNKEDVKTVVTKQLKSGIRGHYFNHVSYCNKLIDGINQEIDDMTMSSNLAKVAEPDTARMQRVKLNADTLKMLVNNLDKDITAMMMMLSDEQKHSMSGVADKIETIKQTIARIKKQ